MPDALETALRELREPASPDFATDLDARVAGRFGAPPGRLGAPSPRPRRPGRLRKLLLPAGGLAAAAALLVVVVSIGSQLDTGGDDSSGASSSGASSSAGFQQRARPAATATGGSGALPAAPASGASGSSGARDRKVERTASLALRTTPRRVEAAAASVSDIASRFGGYVETSSVDARRDGGGGDFVLRVPTARLDRTMAALARVGQVTNRRQTAEDITASANRTRTALGEARAERTSLLRRLATATTDAQTASLRARLRDANAAIDRALTASRRVERRAAYARVDVTLVARSGAQAVPGDTQDGWGPGAAWDDARRVLEVASGVAVITLAVLGPLALLALLALLGHRLHTARARSRVLDSV